MLKWSRVLCRGQVMWAGVLVFIFHMCIFRQSLRKLQGVSPVTFNYQYIPIGSLSFFPEELRSMVIAKNDEAKLHGKYSTTVDIARSTITQDNVSMKHDPQRRLGFEDDPGGLPGDFLDLDYKTVEVQLKEALEQLLHLLSVPDYHCKKFLRIGGFFCNHKPDGEKYVCHDPNLYPADDSCLVYSFGVGHDFTFDMQIDKFGCQVFAFDSDIYHAHYPTYITSGLTFYKVRVGTSFLRETQYQFDNLAAGPYVVEYWPLPAIMAELGHTHHRLHYLKMDIEGDEWKVFEESLLKTDILEKTQQLALEIHLDDLRHGGGSRTLQALLTCVARYLRIVHGLKARGFQLARWEPNYKGSELTTLVGFTFHVFSETLWVNSRYL